MTELLLWSSVFFISLFVLIKASDYFTIAAEEIGLIAGMSPYTVGLTIVALGTSLPELVTSLVAAAGDASEIVSGNVIGSNIANILLILGVGAVLGGSLLIKRDLLKVDLPLLLASSFFFLMVSLDGEISRGESLLFLLCLIIFITYSLSDKSSNDQDIEVRAPWRVKPFVTIVAAGFAVYVGAKYTVESVIFLADHFDVGREAVAVSAVALGTSLPELAVTLSAAKRNNAEMIVGNVLGSNIFNTFAVIGIPGMIAPLAVPQSLLLLGIPIMLTSTFLFLVATLDKQVTRWEGAIFVVMYIFFIGKTFELI